jgi:hypothetical protein
MKQANIGVKAPATCMPLCEEELSHFTMVYVASVLYDLSGVVLYLTQQDEFSARFPKAHHAARIVARTERTY